MQALQPLTLVQAAGLARLQEEKLLNTRPSLRNCAPSVVPIPPRPAPSPALLPLPVPHSPPPRLPPTLKRLSPKEISSRQERGLCFNCDEKYHRGHRCASRVFFLVAEEDEAVDPHIEGIDPSPDSPDIHDPGLTQISFNSLASQLAPKTLRLIGTVAGTTVVILVDGGSTHNFIQESLVTQLGLQTQQKTPLRVMIGNGQHLACNRLCPNLSLTMQQFHCVVDLYVLPIAGANIVLGVQWLKMLGPVLTDYNTMSMKFFSEGQLIELQGDQESTLTMLTPHQFRRLSHNSDTSSFYHIAVLAEVPIPDSNSPLHPSIQTLVDHFAVLFQPPTSLSPERITDDHIHLIPQAAPVNVRPYRYPHFQKHEIELQVESML